MKLENGSIINQYKIISSIGKGGMGEVFLAQDTKLDRKVALKILPSEFAEDADRMSRFVREAKSASALNHPNIITIHEIGESEGTHFIATEYIDGKTLTDYTNANTLNYKSALEIAIQVASALDEAHHAGIVHRDIKPDNVMIRANGLVKLLDFGIAKLSEPRTVVSGLNPSDSDTEIKPFANANGSDQEAATAIKSATMPGMIIGTANYMSPEQAKGKEVDARTDIFSFGVVLYEMIAGELPFAGENAMDMIAAILHKEPKPLKADVPAEIAKIISKCLRKDRDERYQTIKDVGNDLKDIKKELELNQLVERSILPVNSGRETLIHRATTVSEPNLKSFSLKWLWTLAILPILIGGYFVWSSLKPKNSLDKIELKAVTNSSEIEDSTISPDGKLLALIKNERGKQSLWVQQKDLPTSGVNLLEPNPELTIYGIRFTLEGDKIYFLQRKRNDSIAQLFSIPSLGGQPPQRILDNVDSAPTFSPDGSKLAFMRRNTKEGITSLMIAQADGSKEEEIISRKLPLSFILRPIAWSPNGSTIAVAANDESDATAYRVGEINLEKKELRIISQRSWIAVESISWLKDGSALVFPAFDNKRRLARSLWVVDYASGSATQITSDLNDYTKVNVARKTGEIIVQQSKDENGVWVVDQTSSNPSRRISQNNADGTQGLTWADEENLIYTSDINSLNRLQKLNVNGGKPIVLTSSQEFFRNPSVALGGKYITFAFDKDNKNGIWRMNPDGGNLTLLTNIGSEFPDCSNDGWVYFNTLVQGRSSIWKVSIEGGEPINVTDKISLRARVSPDSSKVAFYYRENATAKWEIAIVSAANHEIVKKLDLPSTVSLSTAFNWSADGKSLIFIETKNGLQNLLAIDLETNKQKPLPNTSDEYLSQIGNFAISPSGNLIAISRGRKNSDVVEILGR